MGVLGLDHIVLRSGDQERALAWYTDVLGLAPERVEEWRKGEVPFPSVRIDGGTVIDLFGSETPGGPTGPNLDHFCLVYDPESWERLRQRVVVERGPAEVWGALGQGTSVYTRDPDGTVVELRRY